jgi:hypothetical protein
MPRTALGPCSLCALVAALAGYAAGGAPAAHAWVTPVRVVGEPPCPPVPDASDLDLTLEERARIDAGEIVVRVLGEADRGGRTQAIGYLDANPSWLFELATDAENA